MSQIVGFMPGEELHGKALNARLQIFNNFIKDWQYKQGKQQLMASKQTVFERNVYEFFTGIIMDKEKPLYDVNLPTTHHISKTISIQNSGHKTTAFSGYTDEEFDAIIKHFIEKSQNIKILNEDYEFFKRINSFNQEEFFAPWQYSITVADDLNLPVEQRKYTHLENIIGWNKGDAQLKEVDEVISRLERGLSLNQTQEVIFKFGSRYGASIQDINSVVDPETKRVKIASLVDESTNYQTLDNLKRFKEAMFNIGSEQGVKEFADGTKMPYGQYLFFKDRFETVYDKTGQYDHSIISAYNGRRAEEKVYSAFYSSLTLDQKRNIDLLEEEYRSASKIKKPILIDPFQMLNSDQTTKSKFLLKHGITASSTESSGSLERVFQGLLGDIIKSNAHHQTSVDTTQLSQIEHTPQFVDEIIKPIIEQEVENRKNTLENLSKDSKIYLQLSNLAPFIDNGVLAATYDRYSMNASAIGYGNIFFNNKAVATVDLKTNQGIVSITTNSQFANTTFPKNAIGVIDFNTVGYVESNKAVELAKNMGDSGKQYVTNGEKELMTFKIDFPNGMSTQVVLPTKMAENVISQQNVVGVQQNGQFKLSAYGKNLEETGYYINEFGEKINIKRSGGILAYQQKLRRQKLLENVNTRISNGNGWNSIARASALKEAEKALVATGVLEKGKAKFISSFLNAVTTGDEKSVAQFEQYIAQLPKGIKDFDEAWKFGFGLEKDGLSLYDSQAWYSTYRNTPEKYAGYNVSHAMQEVVLQQEMLKNGLPSDSWMETTAKEIIEQTPNDYARRKNLGEITWKKTLNSFNDAIVNEFLGRGITKLKTNKAVTIKTGRFQDASRKKYDVLKHKETITLDPSKTQHGLAAQIHQARTGEGGKIATKSEIVAFVDAIVSNNKVKGDVLYGYNSYKKGTYDDSFLSHRMDKLEKIIEKQKNNTAKHLSQKLDFDLTYEEERKRLAENGIKDFEKQIAKKQNKDFNAINRIISGAKENKPGLTAYIDSINKQKILDPLTSLQSLVDHIFFVVDKKTGKITDKKRINSTVNDYANKLASKLDKINDSIDKKRLSLKKAEKELDEIKRTSVKIESVEYTNEKTRTKGKKKVSSFLEKKDSLPKRIASLKKSLSKLEENQKELQKTYNNLVEFRQYEDPKTNKIIKKASYLDGLINLSEDIFGEDFDIGNMNYEDISNKINKKQSEAINSLESNYKKLYESLSEKSKNLIIVDRTKTNPYTTALIDFGILNKSGTQFNKNSKAFDTIVKDMLQQAEDETDNLKFNPKEELKSLTRNKIKLKSLFKEFDELTNPQNIVDSDPTAVSKRMTDLLSEIAETQREITNLNVGLDTASPVGFTNGIGFTQTTEEVNKSVPVLKNIVEKAAESGNEKRYIESAEDLANFLGATVENRELYQKNIKGIGAIRSKYLMAIYGEHESGIREYAKSFYESVVSSNGRIFIGSDNTVSVSFAPTATRRSSSTQEITSLLPKLEVLGSVSSTKIGNTSYATYGSLKLNNEGSLKYVSKIRSNIGIVRGIETAIKNAEVLGKDASTVLVNMLSVYNSTLRTENPLGSAGMREVRNNASVNWDELLKDKEQRNLLKQHIKKYTNASGEIGETANKFLAEIQKFESGYNKNGRFYPSQSLENQLQKSLHLGIISSEVEVGSKKIRIDTSNAPHSMGRSHRFSLVPFEYGTSALDNAERGTNYIKEHYKVFDESSVREKESFYGLSSNFIDRHYQIVETADNGTAKYYMAARENAKIMTREQLIAENYGKEVLSSGRSLRELTGVNWEATTKDITDFLKELKESNGNILVDGVTVNQEDIDRLSSLLSTHEGGAFVSGKMADITDMGDYGSRSFSIDKTKNLTKELEDTAFKYIQNEDGNIEIKYNKGYVAKRGENLFHRISSFGNEYSGVKADFTSQVTQKLFTKDGIELSEREANHRIQLALIEDVKAKHKDWNNEQIQKWIKENIDENEIKRIINQDFNIKIVAKNLEIIENMKLMINSEKAESVIGVDALKNLKRIDETIYDFVSRNEEFDKLAKFLGKDNIDDVKLGSVLYRDIAGLKFENPIWDKIGVGEDALKELKEKAIEAAGSEENWKNAISNARFRSTNIIKELTSVRDANGRIIKEGADSVAYTVAASVKHGSLGEEINDTFNKFINIEMQNKNVNRFEAAEKAKEKLSPLFINAKPEIIDGNLILPSEAENGRWGFDFEGLKELRKANGLTEYSFLSGSQNAGEKALKDSTYMIADDAVNFNKDVLIGRREIDSLKNEVFSDKSLDALRQKGEDLSIFADMLDENGKFLDKYKNKSIWTKDLIGSILQDNFFGVQPGEHVLTTEDVKNLSDSERDVYNTILKTMGKEANPESAFISRELVKDFDYWSSGIKADNLAKEYKGDFSEIAEKAKNMGFSEVHAKDIVTDLEDGRAYAESIISGVAEDPNWTWNKDTVVDLANGNEKLRKTLRNEGINDRLFVGHGKFKFTSGTEAVPLPGYQSYAKGIIDKTNDLQIVNAKIDELGGLGKLSKEAPLVKQRNSIIERIKEYQDQYDIAMKNNFFKHNGEGLVQELLQRRISAGANRAKTQIFDVTPLLFGESYSSEFNNYKFNGKSLIDRYKNGEHVSFVIASTEDLERYGYDNRFFENLAHLEDRKDVAKVKSEWLERAKTEGVESFVNRSPSDYIFSTGSTRLYFSDNQSKGVFKTDSITALLMKNDADGDTVLSMMLGARTNKGNYVDLITYRHMLNSAGYQDNAEAAIKNVEGKIGKGASDKLQEFAKVHQQAMMMKTEHVNNFYRNYEEEFRNANSEAEQNSIRKKYSDEITRRAKIEQNKTVVYANSRTFLSPTEADAAKNTWESASNLIQTISKDNKSQTMAEIYQQGISLLKDGNISDEQRIVINEGISAYDKFMEPLFSSFVKTNQEHLGEIDTSFFVLDTFGSSYKNTLKVVDDNTQKAYEATKYWREVIKEGFLTSKKANGSALEGFTESFKTNMDAFIKSNGENAEAREALINLTGQYGKYSAMERYQELIKDVGDKPDIETQQRKLRELASESLDYYTEVFKNMPKNLRGQSTVGLMQIIFGENKFKDIGVAGMLDDGSNPSMALSIMDEIKRNAKHINTEKYHQTFENEQTTKVSQTVKRNARNSLAETARERALEARMPKAPLGKSAIMAAGLAAGIMMAGYVGGNPASPMGDEAAQIERQLSAEEQAVQTYNLPQLTNPNINPSNVGPRTGYVINLNARTEDPNMNAEYVGRAIRNAVTSTYSNRNVNINMNVRQRQDKISNEDLSNYLMQAL